MGTKGTPIRGKTNIFLWLSPGSILLFEVRLQRCFPMELMLSLRLGTSTPITSVSHLLKNENKHSGKNPRCQDPLPTFYARPPPQQGSVDQSAAAELLH